ncbi:MAG: hypothetical protein JWO85_2466 [Candidatus Eremiobacteraeota bacterium]|nr:hypothetical protein [Candidatus Eremiobacteraeota bacterium]
MVTGWALLSICTAPFGTAPCGLPIRPRRAAGNLFNQLVHGAGQLAQSKMPIQDAQRDRGMGALPFALRLLVQSVTIAVRLLTRAAPADWTTAFRGLYDEARWALSPVCTSRGRPTSTALPVAFLVGRVKFFTAY